MKPVGGLQFFINDSGELCALEIQSGQTFVLGETTSMAPAGAVWPGNHSARVHCEAGNLNPLVDGTLVQFDTSDFDTDGFAVGGLPVNQLIIPAGQSGLYNIQAQADSFSSANGATQGILILVNGSIGIAKSDVQEQGSTGSSLNTGAIWRLNEGDYIQVRYQDTNSNPNSYLKIVVPGTPSLALFRVA